MAIEFIGFEPSKVGRKVDQPQMLQGSGIISFYFDNWRCAFRCLQKTLHEGRLTVLIEHSAEEFKNFAAMDQHCSIQLDSDEDFSESTQHVAIIIRIEKKILGFEVELDLQSKSHQ